MHFFCRFNLFLLLFLTAYFSYSIKKLTAEEIGAEEAEKIALANHFELKSLRKEIALEKEISKSKLRNFFPSATISYSRRRSITERDYDYSNHSIKLSLSQPIFDAGRNKIIYEISKINQRIARNHYLIQKHKLSYKVRQAYLDIQEKREISMLLKSSMLNAENIFRRAEKEISLGMIKRLDHQEIQNEYRRRKLSYSVSLRELNDSIENFYHILGKDYGVSSVKHVDFDRITFKRPDQNGIANLFLKRRQIPSLQNLKLASAKKKKEMLIEKYSYIPSFAVTGHYSKNGENWPPENTEVGIGINISFYVLGSSVTHNSGISSSRNKFKKSFSSDSNIQLYDNPLWKKNRMEKQLDLERSLYSQKDADFQNKTSVKRLLQSLREAFINLNLLNEYTIILRKKNAIEKEKFHLGQTSLHDYLREEHILNEVRLKEIREKISYMINAGRLESELGLPLDSLRLYIIQEYSKKDYQSIKRSFRD
ncbi:MAG: TolC family protein [Spirochaetia bacterium]|nr:TolC family protein [Spirochaetia bacterium]